MSDKKVPFKERPFSFGINLVFFQVSMETNINEIFSPFLCILERSRQYEARQKGLAILNRGVKEDYAQAVAFFREAAEPGDAESQLWLGIMYCGGLGVKEDYAQGYMWVNLAAENTGLEQAVNIRNGMCRYLLTPSQIEEGERLTREWLAAHPQARGE